MICLICDPRSEVVSLSGYRLQVLFLYSFTLTTFKLEKLLLVVQIGKATIMCHVEDNRKYLIWIDPLEQGQLVAGWPKRTMAFSVDLSTRSIIGDNTLGCQSSRGYKKTCFQMIASFDIPRILRFSNFRDSASRATHTLSHSHISQ